MSVVEPYSTPMSLAATVSPGAPDGFWLSVGPIIASSEFIAALAGALAGGLISYVINRQNLGAATRERQDALKDRNSVLAHRLVFKFLKVYSALHRLQEYLVAAQARAAAEGAASRLAPFLRPLANLPERIAFEADEMAFLLHLDTDTFNGLMNVEAGHNSLVDLLVTYRVQREFHEQLLPGAQSIDGTIVMFDPNAAPHPHRAASEAALNDLALVQIEELAKVLATATHVKGLLLTVLREAADFQFQFEEVAEPAQPSAAD